MSFGITQRNAIREDEEYKKFRLIRYSGIDCEKCNLLFCSSLPAKNLRKLLTKRNVRSIKPTSTSNRMMGEKCLETETMIPQNCHV